MGRKIFVLFGLLSGLMAGAGLLVDGLPGGPALASAVEEQTQPPVLPSTGAPPAEQPDVTERGLPGQPLPPKPGGQPPIQKVIIPPMMKASTPSAPPKAQQLTPKPGAKPWRSPSLSEKLDAFRNLPGGAEALAEATRRGARLPIQTRGEPNPADPQPWSLSVSPQNPHLPGLARLDLFNLYLSGLYSDHNHYYTLGDMTPQPGARPGVYPPPFPSAVFSVNIPRDGWYILNFEIFLKDHSTHPDTSIELKSGRYSYALPPQNEFQMHVFRIGPDSLDNSSRSLPQLLELGAGYHQFGLYPHWVEAELLEASITEY